MLLAWLNERSGPSVHSDSLKVVVMHRMIFIFFFHCTKCSHSLEVWVQCCCITIIWKLFGPTVFACVEYNSVTANLNKYQKSICICLRCFKGGKKCAKGHMTVFLSNHDLCLHWNWFIFSHSHTRFSLDARLIRWRPSKLTQTFQRFDKNDTEGKNIQICSIAPPYKHYEYRHGQGRS